jgi:hypothetical protein
LKASDYAGMNGLRRVRGGDWFFHEDTITSTDWWKKSAYRGFGIKQALRELIPVSKLHKGKLRACESIFRWAVSVFMGGVVVSCLGDPFRGGFSPFVLRG